MAAEHLPPTSKEALPLSIGAQSTGEAVVPAVSEDSAVDAFRAANVAAANAYLKTGDLNDPRVRLAMALGDLAERQITKYPPGR